MTVSIWNMANHKDNMVGAKPWWDDLVDFCQANVDFKSDLVNKHNELIANLYYIVKNLKCGYISFAMDLVALSMPLLPSCK
eukprot:11062625-Heterocapsa_arctica.AAC.1